MKRLIIAVVALIAISHIHAIDWEGFLARQDMVWDKLPTSWDDAPFLGNGTLGTYICLDDSTGALRIDIGNNSVHDHRPDDPSIYGRGRLPIGHFLLVPQGRIVSGDLRLDLWNAELRGKLLTSRGEISLRAFVAAEDSLIVVEAEPRGGEGPVEWHFRADRHDSPRITRLGGDTTHAHYKKGYRPNPPARITYDSVSGLCVQPLLAGGATATAWRVSDSGSCSILAVTSAHSFPDTAAISTAIGTIRRADAKKASARHRGWWHAYYPLSFVSLPDKRLENFYWIQMYKLASATRADGGLIDNCGPWLTPTPWPNAWWNLNVQLSYWPVYASNRLALGRSLVRAVHDNLPNLINNVAPRYRHDSAAIPVSTGYDLAGTEVKAPGQAAKAQIGCLPWVCHNLWLHYRHSMDTTMLRQTLYPTLRRAINYYLHFISSDPDGTLHLARSYSPEYGTADDCNFDLALLRWGCAALLEAADTLGIDDALAPRWRDVLARLTPYPEHPDEGIMIGRETPYTKSHRHYSHLLMFYPLYLLNADQPGQKELMERSVTHWHSLPGNIYAYSYTGAASMYAAFGEGDRALSKLNKIFSLRSLKPNTLYKESGPVIETPLSAAQSIHDMLLQTWGGKIRIFPAVPCEWHDVSFADLSAEGAFLVSAVRSGGATVMLRIKSLAGAPCVIHTDMAAPAVSDGPATLTPTGTPGEFILDIAKGGCITLTPGGRPAAEPAPVGGHGQNLFGGAAREPQF